MHLSKLLVLALCWSCCHAFAPPIRVLSGSVRPLRALRIRSNKIREARPESPLRALGYEQRRRKTAVFSQFGPGPGGGRGGGGLDPGLLLTLGGVALVFLFPGFVLGTFNFLFIAVTVLPLLLSVGFNLFVKLNVMEAPCPNCGATLQGPKTGRTLCQNCGTMVESSGKGEFRMPGPGYIRDEYGQAQSFRSESADVIDVDAEDVIDID